MTPHAGQWILSGSCPCSRAVATAWVSCPGFHPAVSLTVDPSYPSYPSYPAYPAFRIVLDRIEARTLPRRRVRC